MDVVGPELRNSRQLFGDWARLRALIASDGYIFMRGLLGADEVVLGPHGREIGSRLFASTSWWRPMPPGVALVDATGPEAPVLPAPPSRFVQFES